MKGTFKIPDDMIECDTVKEENNQEVPDMYYKYLISVNKHRTLRVAVISLQNVGLTAIFAFVAHAFDKWWIVLFSLLCISTYKFNDNK